MKLLTFSLPLLLLFLGYGFGCLGGNLGRAADDPKTSTPEVKVREPVKLTENALRIHREALLVDGHNDLPCLRNFTVNGRFNQGSGMIDSYLPQR